MKVIFLFLKSLRFKQQWVKNIFIFAPMVFALRIFELDHIINGLIAFILFGFVTGSIYVFNDCIDRESDRLHPLKSQRPIASGRLEAGPALAAAMVLLAVDLFVIYRFDTDFFLISIVYIAINILYTLYLKKVVILDVMIIAIGFVLRVLIGGVIDDIELSPWILIMTFLISIFLGLVKRRQEMVNLAHSPGETGTRKTLKQYTVSLLDQLISVTIATTLISYVMYVLNPGIQQKFNTEKLFFTIPFVVFGIFRYLYLVYSKKKGESPEEILLSDLPFSLNMVLWVVIFILLILY